LGRAFLPFSDFNWSFSVKNESKTTLTNISKIYFLNYNLEVYLKSGHEDKAWKLNIGVFKIRKGKTWVHREKEKFIAMSLKPVQ